MIVGIDYFLLIFIILYFFLYCVYCMEFIKLYNRVDVSVYCFRLVLKIKFVIRVVDIFYV